MRHQMFNQHGEAVFFAVGSRFHVSRFYPVKSRLIGMMKVEVIHFEVGDPARKTDIGFDDFMNCDQEGFVRIGRFRHPDMQVPDEVQKPVPGGLIPLVRLGYDADFDTLEAKRWNPTA